ncbi:MAG: YceI family protein [Polyangiaceae bacterium]|nr:YceI family protein [Polyangiaceae bacterium]
MTTQRWQLDTTHSGIHFAVRHMVISKVRGAFTRWDGKLEFDAQRLDDSRVSVRIDAASIDTREAKRDEHLRSADFFDVEQFPALTFESKKVEKRGESDYRIVGDLTIHGVTKEVTLETEYLGGGKDPWGNERIGFQAKTTISRKDFGLGWNQVLEAGGVLVGEQVEISLDIQAVKAQSATEAA